MDKNMIQRWIHAIMTLAAIAVLSVSCREDEWFDPSPAAREGYVALRFSADVPAMEKVATRAVDPDGGGVQDMTLFCFDSYGLFITTVTAEVISTDVSNGTFQAQVPENTRTVHFLANQVMTDFEQDQFRSKSEAEVMALLEGSSGRMIYWARFACDNSTDELKKQTIAQQMSGKGNSITMLRNHAKVSVNAPEDNGYFTVKGFAVYNTNAFGTVAPYHPEKGFNFTETDWLNDDFVTIPANDAKLSDVTDVTTNMGQYIFESENSADDPVSIVLYGRNAGDTEDRYYRVMLVDEEGDQILIRRNHDYQLNITGRLSFGQTTFAEALEAAATNNVWISISDRVNEVEDSEYILTVEQTDYVLGSELAGSAYTLSYTVKGKDGKKITEADKAEVTWIDNLVAQQGIANTFKIGDDGVGRGTIIINLLSMGANEKLEGTLLVKHRRLERKIKVILVKEQSFAPSWVDTQIYGGIDQSDPTKDRSHVTVMFTVPETAPAELFPLKVYISVGGLDIRPESGMALTVVRDGEKDWYSSGDITPEPDYKYLYIVEHPGVQRVYFHNILSQNEDYQGHLYIEAEHFETMKRVFTYSNTRNSITVEGLKAYNAQGGGIEGYPDDELILYRLVPQKRHANIQFDLQLREKTGDDLEDHQKGDPFNAGEKDEFLLYSWYLDYYEDNETGQAGVDAFDCTFYPDESAAWWQTNNPSGGRMLMFKPKKEILNRPTGSIGKYSIYMKSNRPKSAEVIRIASNINGTNAVLPEDNNGVNNEYGGNSYRSVTFELANYNPFRFGARLNYNNEGEQGKEPDREGKTEEVPELLTPLEWTYEPGKPVDIAIDITSFAGSDGNSVDPFGEEFEIYIDAPMLALGSNAGLDDKLYEASSGRFVYKVDSDRETERSYFSGSKVINEDNTPGENVNQSGERKTLHFTTKSIVSAGDIVISSNEEKVVFYSKTFRVTNKSMGGNIYYEDESGSLQPIPSSAFVAFERVSNSSRIGAVTVTADGRYELRLRKEYTFDWYTNPVQFHYKLNGKVYHCTYESLSELFKSQDDVILTLGN